MGNLSHTTGNVGIGTSNPLVPLDVRGGSIRVNNSGSFEQSVNFDNSASGGWARGLFFVDDTATSSVITALGAVTGGIGMYGVGTNAPPTRIYFGVGNSPWSTPNGIHLLKNGNLGIGVVSPTTTLDVNGDMKISGTLTVNQISGFTASGTIKCSTIDFTGLSAGVTVAAYNASATSGLRYNTAAIGDYTGATTGNPVNTWTPVVAQYGKLVVVNGLVTNTSTTSTTAGTVIIKGLPPPKYYTLFSAFFNTSNAAGSMGRVDIATSGDMSLQTAWAGSARRADGYGSNYMTINVSYITA